MIQDNESLEVFEKPKSLFQQKINEIMTETEASKTILDIFELQMYKNAEKDDKKLVFVELYNLLGMEKFVEVMELLGGKTVKFPSRDDFKETIEIALAYYYRTFRNYDWANIKELIGDKDMSTVKFGAKMQQMKKFIDYLSAKVRSKKSKEIEELKEQINNLENVSNVVENLEEGKDGQD